ncbi:MAG TPA: fimbrillin family protein [Rikenellaceae bacterium]|nr:fimbrillin family protein [Rikenellaceae bacterium]
MNNKLFILAIAPAMLVLGSCNKTAINGPTPKYITVSTDIATKVTTAEDGSQSFANGDKISVYAWTGDPNTVPAQGSRVVDNAINTLGTDGKWTAEPQMLWKNLKDKHYFIGVYPHADVSETDLTKVACSVDPAKQVESDILVATEFSGKIAENNPVSLTFDHMMAKVIVELSYRNQWGGADPEVTAVVLKNVVSDGTLNYLTKTITPSAVRADMSIPVVTSNRNYASVIIPQTGVNEVVVKIDGKDFSYVHGKDFSFEKGKYTTIKLIVGRNKIDLGEVAINEWGEGSVIEGGEALD